MNVPCCTYGNETWTIRKTDKRHIKSSEIIDARIFTYTYTQSFIITLEITFYESDKNVHFLQLKISKGLLIYGYNVYLI